MKIFTRRHVLIAAFAALVSTGAANGTAAADSSFEYDCIYIQNATGQTLYMNANTTKAALAATITQASPIIAPNKVGTVCALAANPNSILLSHQAGYNVGAANSKVVATFSMSNWRPFPPTTSFEVPDGYAAGIIETTHDQYMSTASFLIRKL
ncbi:hypothetical protein [Streptomyces osmaniensis]|uniref:Uncharacterized protein n=1 Tax=Streptomyces osmaniensis TaxID=593134 RepID=A0ABP6Z025_9ACTN|nr:hypothetical protein KJK32_45950 [Streptomyces sp. JCM17656]